MLAKRSMYKRLLLPGFGMFISPLPQNAVSGTHAQGHIPEVYRVCHIFPVSQAVNHVCA